MTVATGYRPRPWEHHLRLAAALSRAPARVAIDHADDGWVAAHLAVCGRAPVWASNADPRPVQRTLVRLGLPGLVEGPADARITYDLVLKGTGRPRRVTAPAPPDVDIVTTVSGAWQAARDAVRTLQGQGRLILVDRSDDPAVSALLDRVPRARVLRCPGASSGEALAAGLAAVERDAVLIVPESSLLLPGALAALHHTLRRSPGPAVALGDALHLDAVGAFPLGIAPAPRLPEHRGEDILAGLGAAARPLLLDASLLDAVPAPSPCAAPEVWLRGLGEHAAVRVVPLWTSGSTRPQPRHAATDAPGPGLALVPPESAPYLVIDDGDEGALAETLDALPPGARTAVLRAVPDAVAGPVEGAHLLLGGLGDLDRVDLSGPISLRLTSDPSWSPPPLSEPSLLTALPLPLPSAVVAVAAVLGWSRPYRRRAVGRDRVDASARLAQDAREALDQGDRRLAFTLGRALSGALPGWPGADRFLDLVERRLTG